MSLHKLTTTTAWLILDLDGAPSFGPTTLGPRVLQVNAKLYARAGTYKFALCGANLSGGAGGIKVDTEDRGPAVQAFVTEMEELAKEGRFHTTAGFGVGYDELAPLYAHDPRHPASRAHEEELTAASLSATALAALGDPSGATVVLGALNPLTQRVAAELTAAGATVVGAVFRKGAVVDPAGLDTDRLAAIAAAEEATTAETEEAIGTEADLYLAPGHLNAITHDNAGAVGARRVLGTGDLTVSPRAVADLGRRDIVVWPDFLGTLGPTLAGQQDHGASLEDLLATVRSTVGELATAVDEHPEGPIIGACLRAEEHLATWQDPLPFGRPLP